MKILFLSEFASSLPLAVLCQEEGHDVRFFIKDESTSDIGDGFIPVVKDYKNSVDWSDLVICDYTRWGSVNDDLRAKGKPVIGGSEVTDAIEEDRGAGQKLFKALGMDILETDDFDDIEKAITFIKSEPARYVVKVNGKAQEDSGLTYVGEMEDGQDAIAMLEHFKGKTGSKIDSVSIQLHIEGIEVALGGFFNGDDFLEPVFFNFEHKKLLPGTNSAGIGPNTGEMGTCALWISKDQPIYKETIGKMVPILKKQNYHGYYDINLIVHDDSGKGPHIHPLEATCRFGWPTLPLQMETLKENDLGEFFFALASGKSMEPRILNPWSTCVVVGMPPFPYESNKLFEKYADGIPVLFKDNDLDGIYPADVQFKNGNWIMAGTMGHVAICCGSGGSLEDSLAQAYEHVDKVVVPNKIYRIDIGKYVGEYLDKLSEYGFYESDSSKKNGNDHRPIVIKCGGIYLDDEKEREKMIKDVIKLASKQKVILVHGGGDEISKKMEARGEEPEYQDGRRYTPPDEIGMVEDTLRDINHDLVKEFNDKGLVAVSHSGHGLMNARNLEEMGLVGIPESIDQEGLQKIIEDDAVPIFYSVTPDENGSPLNVNADDFAGFLAYWSGAKELIYLNEDGGVLDEQDEIIPEISVNDISFLADKGVLREGKLLKATYAKLVIDNGADRARISETIKDEGTVFVK